MLSRGCNGVLTFGFDTVNRNALWAILEKLGCPANFTNLVSALHKGVNTSVSR